MDSELENEKFSSLYLEQILSNPKDLDALIHQRENASAIADNIVAHVGDSALEQQALLQDMFRLVSREGANQIIDNADAVFTLFQNFGLNGIFAANGERLHDLYVNAVQAQTKQRPEDIYGAIDKLLEVGRRIAPFLPRGRTRQIADAWDMVRDQFRKRDDRSAIYLKAMEIYDAIRSSPKMGDEPKKTYEKSDIDRILKAVNEHPDITYSELARETLKEFTPKEIRYIVNRYGRKEGIEKRKRGRVAPPGRDEKVLKAILEHPEMEYAQIARDILHIEPQDMFYFAKRLRSAGKLEKKEVWSRRPKAKKDKQDS